MTDQQHWQEETREIIRSLFEDGSNPEVNYTIEHHFSGLDFDRLEKAALDCFKAEFEVSDAEELALEDGQTILCFDAVKESPLNEAAIMAHIEQLLKIAEKYGVEYDGWGTYFEE
ncbi:regulator of ribonuclease activity B [Oceanisphaera marina]|uniref:Regulator of ribonuclease activity B n=1 Tax=Oceanisphaera marina TaxID=2017550 RepID=A0ABQ1IE27_9GAMM|nr:ribonuclease E inhibitor RraB [Oceanisphaera marina]GGB36798.1 regulator of ribonuclease activity B [Oceanisphaera marina]